MTSGNGSLRARLPGLADAMKALLTITPQFQDNGACRKRR